MANHYRTIGCENRSITTRGRLPTSLGQTWGDQKQNLRQETNRPPKSIESLSIHTKTQVGSEGTPHVGHADSVTNDEHGSRSDISD